jgi:RNA polymerase sigma-70 factor (ECF subfamily)
MPARVFADADPDDPGDEALMLAYAAGDAGAFDMLYARHKGGVYRYLVRHCGNASTADELFQDVWMNVIRARAAYAPSAEFVATDVDGDAPDPLAFVPGARGDEPEVRVGAREQRARIDIALIRLPAVQREAFLLHQEGGLDLAAIAALTGAGIETVKSRLRYALAKLRIELADLQ